MLSIGPMTHTTFFMILSPLAMVVFLVLLFAAVFCFLTLECLVYARLLRFLSGLLASFLAFVTCSILSFQIGVGLFLCCTCELALHGVFRLLALEVDGLLPE